MVVLGAERPQQSQTEAASQRPAALAAVCDLWLN